MSSAPKLIRILTVDDHPLLRKGIAALVNAEPDMKLVGEASNGQEAIESFRLHRPDVHALTADCLAMRFLERVLVSSSAEAFDA
jgi:chemotaxis response regulator CheB